MTTLAIIQARMSSSRFPGKVLADLDGLPMIVFMARRVAKCPSIDGVIVATSDETSDDLLAKTCKANELTVFRGPLNNVLQRFAMVQAQYSAEVMVRMTGDCPLADPRVIDGLIALRAAETAHYASNVEPRSFPHGFDCEAFTAETLRRAVSNARDDYDREHVTPWMRSDEAGLRRANLLRTPSVSSLRLTVDHPADLEVIRAVVADVGPDAALEEVVKWCVENPEIMALNAAHRTV
ncbi:MAG: glycosyltransferase family protein [Pseudomonadota bacterium]